MSSKIKITPDTVEKIEDFLEERKMKTDRRGSKRKAEESASTPEKDRRSGSDRRDRAS